MGSPDPKSAQRASRHLAQRMGRLRGLPQKLGQSLSLGDVDQEATPFKDLTESADPVPFEKIASILNEVWGVPWREVLSHIETRGRAASLGQVHKASLPDDKSVAVKVAYPDIREAVINDLRMLGWLARPAEWAISGFQFQEYRDVLFTDLEEELDYRIEAQQQQRYASLVHPSDRVVVPQVVPQLSSERVLVTQWEDGQTIDQATRWGERERTAIGVSLVRHFLNMLFHHGLVHADPHPGNYRFRQSGEVVLYDFGSVAKLNKKQRLLLLRLILATQNQAGDPFSLLQGLGFKPDLLEPIRAKLPVLCQVLFEPFLNHMKFDPSQWDRAKKIDHILGEDRWNFRLSGPASFVFVIRGFQGLLYYLDRLKVQVSWHLLLKPILDRWMAEVLAVAAPPPTPAAFSFRDMASLLNIQVERNGEKVVALKFPANAIHRLDTLIGDDVLEKIRQKGIDPQEVIRKARAGGLKPMDLFSLDEGEKHIRVWLA